MFSPNVIYFVMKTDYFLNIFIYVNKKSNKTFFLDDVFCFTLHLEV